MSTYHERRLAEQLEHPEFRATYERELAILQDPPDPASSAGSTTAPQGAAAREQERHDGEPGS